MSKKSIKSQYSDLTSFKASYNVDRSSQEATMSENFVSIPLSRRRFLRNSMTLLAIPCLGVSTLAQALDIPGQFRFVTNTPFPDATNTGVPAGITLTNSGSITTQANGQVIQNLNISGYINVRHANVIIRQCKVTNNDRQWAAIVGGPNTLVEDCEVDGSRTLGSYGIGVSGTVRRCKVYGVENGLNPQSNSTYEDNYVYGLNPTGVDPHSDAVPMQGGASNVIVRHNTLDITGSTGFNAHFFINSYFGATDNVLIENNLCIGVPAVKQGLNCYSYRDGSWPALTNVRFRNNVFKLAPWGVFSDQNGQGPGRVNVLTEWSGNTNYDTGAIIPKPV